MSLVLKASSVPPRNNRGFQGIRRSLPRTKSAAEGAIHGKSTRQNAPFLSGIPGREIVLTHLAGRLFSVAPVSGLDLFMAKLTIRDLNVRGKRVFLRVDYNVPLEEKDGTMVITDDTRIVETLPTLNALINQGGRLILTAHLGRPKGQRESTM